MSPWDLNIRSPMMKNLATGEVLSQRDLPVGALFDANAHPENRGYYRGAADGCHIVCVLPDGNHWHIDSRASNCDMKKDDEHRCWVRHGTVGGTLHVDKNGKTCGAGAGSIKTARWHGFLHNGVLSERG